MLFRSHKSGVLNRVADALSRRASLLITMQTKVLGFDLFRELLSNDPYFGLIMDDVATRKQFDFLIHDDFLFKGNQLCIPDSSLCLRIIQELHNEGYMGRDKTIKLMTDFLYLANHAKGDYQVC